MTKLEQALAAVSKLSTEEQDAIATLVLQQIELKQKLTTETAQAEIEITEIVEPEILAYMERQAEIFAQMKPDLIKQYLGKYVLFAEGQVLDVDENESALVLRAFAKTGPRPLFIKKVILEEPLHSC